MAQFNDQNQVMQKNLQKLVNQSYFSCFLSDSNQVKEPSNPFRKKLFDKNLRRSTVSCGHYDSVHNYESSRVKDHIESDKVNQQMLYTLSQRIIEEPLKIKELQKQIQQKKKKQPENYNKTFKTEISSIISHFRQQLDYLQQKMLDKINEYQKKYEQSLISSQKKDREIKFMIQNLDKILGFMIENCLNLQDDIISENINDSVQDQSQNQSVGENHEEILYEGHQSKEKARFIKRIRQIQGENNLNQQNIPNSYYVNQKNHMKIQNTNNQKVNKDKSKRVQKMKKNQVYLAKESQKFQANQPKSIYEVVLEERQKRMNKLKKKVL